MKNEETDGELLRGGSVAFSFAFFILHSAFFLFP